MAAAAAETGVLDENRTNQRKLKIVKQVKLHLSEEAPAKFPDAAAARSFLKETNFTN